MHETFQQIILEAPLLLVTVDKDHNFRVRNSNSYTVLCLAAGFLFHYNNR